MAGRRTKERGGGGLVGFAVGGGAATAAGDPDHQLQRKLLTSHRQCYMINA